jgi:hypothetical protein
MTWLHFVFVQSVFVLVELTLACRMRRSWREAPGLAPGARVARAGASAVSHPPRRMRVRRRRRRRGVRYEELLDIAWWGCTTQIKLPRSLTPPGNYDTSDILVSSKVAFKSSLYRYTVGRLSEEAVAREWEWDSRPAVMACTH